MNIIGSLTRLPLRLFLPLAMLFIIVIALIISYNFMRDNQIAYLKSNESKLISYSFDRLIHDTNDLLNMNQDMSKLYEKLAFYAKLHECDVGLFNANSEILYTNNPQLKLWTPKYMKMLRSFNKGDVVWRKKHFLSYQSLEKKGLFVAYHKDLDLASGAIHTMAVEMLKNFTVILLVGLFILGLIYYFLVTKRVKSLLKIIAGSHNNPDIKFDKSLQGNDEIAHIASEFQRLLMRLKKSNKETFASLNKFNLLNEASPDGIFILSPHQTILHYNRQLLRFLDICDQDIADVDITTILGKNEKGMKTLFNDALRGKKVDVQTICRQSYGSIVPVNLRLRSIKIEDFTYVLGFLTDITEAERHKKLVQESEYNFQAILNQMYTFVAVLDVHGHVKFVNSAPLLLSKLKLADIQGKPFYKIMWWAGKSLPEEIKGDIATVSEGGIVAKELQIQINDTQTIWINFSMHPAYDLQGKMVHIVVEGIDITEKKEATENMIRQARKAQMGEMVSIIAHQWRQPLAVISSLASKIEIASSFSEDIEMEKDMQKIGATVSYLNDTMNSFTNFFNPNKKPKITNFTTILNKLMEIMRSEIQNKGIDISIEYSNDINFVSFEDEIIQVVMDFIKNSRDFFVDHEIKEPKIAIIQSADEHYSYLTVNDNAGGIPDEVMPKLFDPYFSTKKESGTGLGLYMSKMIIDEHCRGKLEAFQIEGGASFRIALPIEKKEHE